MRRTFSSNWATGGFALWGMEYSSPFYHSLFFFVHTKYISGSLSCRLFAAECELDLFILLFRFDLPYRFFLQNYQVFFFFLDQCHLKFNIRALYALADSIGRLFDKFRFLMSCLHYFVSLQVFWSLFFNRKIYW